MIDISVNGIKKSFEIGNNILDGITFQVETGERVGLLGRNGAGKSTLFRILTGELEPDEGEVVIPRGRRLGLISQIPVFPVGYTVEDVLNTAFSRHQKLAAEMEALAAAMAAGDSSEATLRRYGELSAKFEGIGGYDTATAVGKVANGLGISQAMREQLFDSLSGGEKTRVNLGRLILEDTDILLLDEPTNHLDLHAVEWLEDYVRRFKGTVVAISHDRYFLDRTISRVIEICDGKAEFYSGNYTFYAIEKERRYQEKLRQYEKEQAKIRQLQEAADKLHLWAFMGNDKLHKRAFSMERRIERIRQTEKPTKARAPHRPVRRAGVRRGRGAGDPRPGQVLRGENAVPRRGGPGGGGRAHRPHRGQRHRQVHPPEDPHGGGAGGPGAVPLRPHRPGGLPAPDHPLRQPGPKPGGHHALRQAEHAI